MTMKSNILQDLLFTHIHYIYKLLDQSVRCHFPDFSSLGWFSLTGALKGHIDYFQPEAVMVRCNLRPKHLKSQERSVLCSCSIVVWNLHWVTRPSMLLPLLRLLLLQHWRTSRRILNLSGDGIETISFVRVPPYLLLDFYRTYRSYDNNIGDGIKCILIILSLIKLNNTKRWVIKYLLKIAITIQNLPKSYSWCYNPYQT